MQSLKAQEMEEKSHIESIAWYIRHHPIPRTPFACRIIAMQPSPIPFTPLLSSPLKGGFVKIIISVHGLEMNVRKQNDRKKEKTKTVSLKKDRRYQ